MDLPLAALADPARWRLVTLLAERPRPVGVLARLAGARQPQTTKHLQTLERAGVVESQRSGQRRVYALRPETLREVAAALSTLADNGDSVRARESFDSHGRDLARERFAAQEPGWADGRSFDFSRALAAPPDTVWQHLTEAPLLAQWWTPEGLRVSHLVFDARPGGQILHEYRDIEDLDGTDLVVGRARGEVIAARPGQHLAYRLSPTLPGNQIAFAAHVSLDLRATDSGADLDVNFRITDSTIESADFIAGIELGFRQSLDHLVAILAASPDTTDTPGSTT